MELDEAITYLRGRHIAHFSDSGRMTLTLGSARSSAGNAEGYPQVVVLEAPVFVKRAPDELWDVWRDYSGVGRLLVASFMELREAVEFAASLVNAAVLAEDRTRPRAEQ
ncbi:MAG: hypothetical protein ACOZQL_30070 [Myxococcota bacterium]